MDDKLPVGFSRMDLDLGMIEKIRAMPKKEREALVERLKAKLDEEIKKKLGKVVKELVKIGKISKDEIDNYSKPYMYEYLNMVAFFRVPGTEMPIFMTTSGELLKVRDKLQEKFGVEIMDPGEAMDRAEAEKKKNAGYIS